MKRCAATRLLFFGFLVSASSLGRSQPSVSSSALFPVPEGLRPNVDFWLKIYTRYTTNDVVIHDSNHLEIIYTVVKLKDSPTQPYENWKRVWATVRRYQQILRNLASLEPIDPAALQGEALRVYLLWQRVQEKNRFRQAAVNVRAQLGQRDRFMEGLIRSGLYVEHIQRVFREYGLPEELAALPHVESSFNTFAQSRMGAAGIWQITRSTGRSLLRIGYEIDERFDPIHATEVAAKILKRNYEALGTWPLAITAYNHGLNGMKRAVRITGSTDLATILRRYRSPNFAFASKNFYAEFLASLHAWKNAEKYFGKIQIHGPAQFLTYRVPHYVKLPILAQKFGLSVQQLHQFNPSLRSPVLKGQRYLPKDFPLRIPAKQTLEELDRLYAQIPVEEKFAHQMLAHYHRVSRGETLAGVARRYAVSPQQLMAANNLTNEQLYVGQVLEIPTKERPLLAEAINPLPVPVPKLTLSPSTPPPHKRDSLTSKVVLLTWREERAPSIVIAPAEPTSEWVTVLPDETLGHFADWLRLPTQELRRLNKLRAGQEIRIGQRLRLSFVNVSAEDFERRRLEYHKSIEEDFFAAYRIAGTKVHRLKRGETMWHLTQTYQVPYWLLQKYNQEVDLTRVKPGDTLVIPNIAAMNEG